MSTEIAKRNVVTELSGKIHVTERNMTFSDLRDLVHLAEAHGVRDDAVVKASQSSQWNNIAQAHVMTTTIEMEAPVTLEYGSASERRPVSPARRRLTLRVRHTAIVASIVALASPVALLVVGLFLRLLHLAIGWV